MDDTQFQELFIATHKENVWELRKKRVKRILEGLLNGEFKDEIEERRFLIRITKLKSNVNARIYKWAKPVIIELSSERWERHPELDDHDIKETLRHELLHISLNAGDADPLFKSEAKRRNIGINFP